MNWIDKIAFVCAIVLPMWNIPLIMRIIKRRSSEDISEVWVLGVWFCLLGMAPSGFQSDDPVWRIFNIMNILLFSFVVITVFTFRHKAGSRKEKS